MDFLKKLLLCLLLVVCAQPVDAQFPAITDSAEAQVGISDTTTTEEELLLSSEPVDVSVQPDVVLRQYVYHGTFDLGALSDSLQTRYENLFIAYRVWEEFFFPFQGYVLLAKLSDIDFWDILLKLLPMVLLLLYLRKYLRKLRQQWAATSTASPMIYSLENLERDLIWGLWLLLFGIFFSSLYLLLPGTLLSLWKGIHWLHLYKHRQKNTDDNHTPGHYR